jgi:arylsulfatase
MRRRALVCLIALSVGSPALAQDTAPAPARVRAPEGAPNILLVLTDDVGFGASSSFGGEIPTPNLDRLASQGLRYNRFHTTGICSPTRAALLTGRNHHSVATGMLTDLPSGHPGYTGILPRSAASVARVLRDNGYSTAMFGKHHNLVRTETSQAGPFDRWPTGLGFEYFYGFIGGDTNQFHPKLYRDTAPVEPSQDRNYILDRDLADDAIRWVHEQKAAAPDKPFFLYFAPGTTHAPHQAPKEWIARFRGRFDPGWDEVRKQIFARQKAAGVIPADAELTPRPAQIPAWASLGAAQKKVSARMMEVYAGMLAFQDAQFGRILDELARMGLRDGTLVMFIEGDNGASGEGTPRGTLNEIGVMGNDFTDDPEYLAAHVDDQGGPDSYQVYPIGWAWAMDSPFQWVKQIASHLGATRNGLVVSWPRRIQAHGEIRSQFHHVIDVAPTLLEVAGVPWPTAVDGIPQQRVDGVSMVYSFDSATAADRRTTQYFEMLGNRALYRGGWLVNTTPRRMPWMKSPPEPRGEEYRWELYDLNRDFSQAHDLAEAQPERLAAMQAAWWQEAERNQVLPVDDDMRSRDRVATQAGALAGRPSHFTYWSPDTSVGSDSAPVLGGRSFTVTAHVKVPPKGGEGVLVASGSRFAGFSFYLEKGRPVALYAFSHEARDCFEIAGAVRVPPGEAELRCDFEYDGGGLQKGGLLRIRVNGEEVASGRIGRTFLMPAGIGETFDVGRDTGLTVTPRYAGEFNGEIRRVDVDLGPLMQPSKPSAAP